MADLMNGTAEYEELVNKYGNFLVPAMKIKSGGTELISSLDLSVTELTVTLSLESAGMAIIRLGAEYDIKSHSFNSKVKNSFKLGTILEIEVGYLSATTAVFKGYIAGVGAEFGELPLIVVKVMDVRKLMMTSGVKRALYEDKNYSDVFKKVIGNYSKLCSAVCDATDDKLVSPISQSTNDYDFVKKELIKKGKSDREFFVLYDKAYFRKPCSSKTPIMSVNFGRELLRFGMMADYLDTSINVIGYDPVNCKDISSKVTAKTTEKYTPVLSPTPSQFFIDADADSESKAKTRAGAIAEKLTMDACFAEGELIGIPEIVPGRYLQIKDLEDMADKKYYLSEVTHRVTESRFSTFFEARGWA
ncbi:MAG: hypothetical protein IJT87_01770 [Ruminiclostridium sp.]|nr:hypothetical protein [Ruminiclostridium sp.]